MTKRKSRSRRKPAKPIPFTGDHGTGTAAAIAGTYMRPVDGQEHNHTGQRVRKEHWEHMGLNGRQWAAAQEIRDAYCEVEMLSSGDALKEAVDTSDRPDATIDVQTDAQSRLNRALRGVPRGMPRQIVEAILRENRDPDTLPKEWASVRAQFKVTMDLVANRRERG